MSEQSYRPRSATEIIDDTFRLYRENFGPLVMLSAVLYLPMLALTIPTMAIMSGMATAPSEQSTLLLTGITVVSLFWYPVMWGALTVSVSERYLGRDIQAGDALRRALGRYGALLGAVLAKWVIISLSMIISWILLFFPTGYLLARFFAVPATVVLENTGVGQSFRRSGQLSIKQKLRIFGTLFLSWAIVIGISVAIYLLMLSLLGIPLLAADPEDVAATSSMVLQLPSIVMYILLVPIIIIVETLLYYDARIRQEGYDIELMSAQLAGPEARVATN